MARIDAHHHLWHYSDEEYGWIDDSMRVLRRDFTPADLAHEMQSAGVDGAVAVQARQTVEETAWLLELAAAHREIRGVVGWLPIAADNFSAELDRVRANPHLKGLRHVVQGEPAGFLDGDAFNRGIASLEPTGLVYDILIFARQLPEAVRFVDRHPRQPFVLDHIAKPDIRNGEIANWSRDIGVLAQRENVTCKISGMVTEADPRHWSAEQLRPYFDVVLEAFGPDRLMIGTDWPVLNVGSAYAEWWRIVEGWVSSLSPSEQAGILGGTAERVYRLG